jgi:hypothetical protein
VALVIVRHGAAASRLHWQLMLNAVASAWIWLTWGTCRSRSFVQAFTANLRSLLRIQGLSPLA